MTAPTIPTIAPPPWRANGDEIIYNLIDITIDGRYAPEIISGGKRYTLISTHSNAMEATYKLIPQQETAMPTPTTPTNDRMTAQELRAAFDMIERDLASQGDLIAQIKSQLDSLALGIQYAASVAGPDRMPTATDGTIVFMADTIAVSIGDDGKLAYKVKGAQFTKFGVRVWPETLPALGVDLTALRPGPNQIPPLKVRALLTESGQPRKVTGKA